MTAAEAAVEEFKREMLAELRREFFQGRTDKQFYQEHNALLQAIAYPARYLNDRGATALPSKYRAILRTVIDTIKRHGNRAKIHRFSVYFLDCVQKHMAHHGDDYYQAAKAARPVASMLDPALRKLQVSEAGIATEALSTAHRALRQNGGRKRAPAPPQPELFGSPRG